MGIAQVAWHAFTAGSALLRLCVAARQLYAASQLNHAAIMPWMHPRHFNAMHTQLVSDKLLL